ncbi:MAG: helix-turn-helix transcriptional regulator [Desulfobacteraceae bacterium]|nr:helix-turn-helix transcriptional regulator [Desulfobacteraceae bacterium]MBC2757256.1 helix-turn-helix transcriptional regulator [Desulfobacteraceae bacterium]
MSQTTQLLNTLKKCLKAKGITYRQLAEELDLSEASIKRLFSEQTFSLKRLEEICNILDLNFYDLTKISVDAETGPSILTLEQETVLSEKPKLLVYFYLLLNGREPGSIVKDYNVSEKESLQYLLELDRLKLIELYPDNKVRLLTQKNITWRKDGPILKRYEKQIIDEFLRAPFDLADQRLRFETGKLSDGSQSVMLKKIDRLFKEYYELTEIDKALPQEKSHNTGLMIAFRPWIFSMMDDFKR